MKILLLGATGLLGSNIRQQIRNINLFEFFDLFIPSHSELDLTELRCIPRYLQQLHCNHLDILINCIGYAKVKESQLHKELAYALNDKCTEQLLEAPPNTKIYHISTDYVYNPLQANSKETDILKPIGVYSHSKAAGDTRLLSFCDSRVRIIRTSFKPRPFPYDIAFSNVYTNADYVDVIAKMILDFILLDPPSGVFNLGTATKTVLDLARQSRPEVRECFLQEGQYPFISRQATMDLTKYHKFLESQNVRY